MTPRMRAKNRLRELVDEVTALRAQVVHQEIYSAARDEALRDFVNQRIGEWNAAIRATNGPRRGESATIYQARLVEANKRHNASDEQLATEH